MPHPRMRTARRLGAATAAAALAAVGLSALPAQAAAPSDTGNLFAFQPPDAQTIVPQSATPQGTAYRTVTPSVIPEGTALTGVTVTVNASGLAGIAELSLPSQCSFTDAAHLHASCALGSVGVSDLGSLNLGLRADAGAAAGAHGTLRFAVTATNAVEDPSDAGMDDTPVVIGDGADLAVQQLGSLTVKPGGSTSISPQVSNLGDRASKGVVMFIDAESLGSSTGFSVGGNYSNCEYGVGDQGDPTVDDSGVLCRFDSTAVQPGDVLVPSAPIPVEASATGTNGYVVYGFDVTGGPLDQQTTHGHAGTGAPLTLVPVPAAKQPQANLDIDYDNNVDMSTISTGLVDDVAAIGANVHGTVGQGLPLAVGVRNAGTAPTGPMLDGLILGAHSAKDTAEVIAWLPSGVTVSQVPSGCKLLDPSDLSSSRVGAAQLPQSMRAALAASPPPASTGPAPGGPVYLCLVARVLQPGQSALFDFTVKPTKALRQVQGAVFVAGALDDDNAQDDMAALSISAVAASAASSGTPSGPASAAPTGGGLAATGGGDDSLPLAGVGAVAVLLGAGAVLFARRRRSGDGGS